MDRLRPLLIFIVLLISYGYFYQGGGWNQNSRLDLTRAMVEQGTLRIDAYHSNTNDKARYDGSFYCDKAPGVSWAGAPWYAAVRLVLGERLEPRRLLTAGAYLATLGAIGLPAALSALALVWLAALFGLAPRWQTGIAMGYGLGTLAFPYATLLYGHQLAAALLVMGFAMLVAVRRQSMAPRLMLLAAGLLLGFAVTAEYPALVGVVVLLGYGLLAVRPRRQLLWLALGLALPMLALMLYHGLAFGSPWTLPYDFSTRTHRHAGMFMGIGVPDPAVAAAILFGPYRGLFFSSPWLLLGVAGLGGLLRRRESRLEAVVCALMLLPLLWMNAALVDWEGGWTLGPRYLIPALPFLALASAGVLGEAAAWPRWRRVRRVLVPSLIGVSVVLMLIGTSVKPEVPMENMQPWSTYLVPHFLRGELALNRTGFDDYMPTASRRAWNLGQQMGLKGLVSLQPLLMLWGFAGWLLFRRQPVRAAGRGRR